MFRRARRGDVPALARLLSEDRIGAHVPPGPGALSATFDALQAEARTSVIVGEADGEVIACYQLTILTGLSLVAPVRGLLEGVRVAPRFRGAGIGSRLMADAESRARAAGATLLQFTSNAARGRAHRFYARLGYVASHTGFRKPL